MQLTKSTNVYTFNCVSHSIFILCLLANVSVSHQPIKQLINLMLDHITITLLKAHCHLKMSSFISKTGLYLGKKFKALITNYRESVFQPQGSRALHALRSILDILRQQNNKFPMKFCLVYFCETYIKIDHIIHIREFGRLSIWVLISFQELKRPQIRPCKSNKPLGQKPQRTYIVVRSLLLLYLPLPEFTGSRCRDDQTVTIGQSDDFGRC